MSDVYERVAQMPGNLLRRSAMNIRRGAGVFERALSGKGFGTVVEIGTYRGVSAAEMSRYCERVVTIDLAYGQLERGGERFNRRAFWASLDCSNIDLHLVADDREKAQLLRSLDFEFAFIDGGHDASSVALDFDLVKRCGHVLFHDADDNRAREFKQNAPNHVYEFVASLPEHEVEFLDIFALWTATEKVPYG